MTSCDECLFVCPSVLLSVTFVYCVKMTEYVFKLFHHRIANHSSFFPTKIWQYFLTRTPLTGGRVQAVGKIAIFKQYLA